MVQEQGAMIIWHGNIRQKPMQGEEKGGLHWTSNSYLPACPIPNEAKPSQNSEQKRDIQSMESNKGMGIANATCYLSAVI
jgi:hypothetical protein